jgi:elongation factor Ts
MLIGRIKKFYKEVCLLEQVYIKDTEITVEKYLENVKKELGIDIEIVKFARYERGEGIEKKTEDFASEIAKMAGHAE